MDQAYRNRIPKSQAGQTPPALCILFTCIGRRIELVQAFRHAARYLQITLTVIGADVSPSAPALPLCDHAIAVPPIHDPDYIPSLLRICREHNVNALIPTIDTDLLPLAQNRPLFEALGTQVLVADPEKVAVCRDKRRTAAYFRSLGLTTPETVDSYLHYTSGFPAFIKPFDGSGSIHANRAENMAQLEQLAKKLPGGYIIQPFVNGTEYSVDVFCDFQGRPVYITPRIRMAVRDGEALQGQIYHHRDITAQILHLLKDLLPRGPITVQLIRDVSGINHYIEINPRFGGGAPLSMKAGADSARALLQLLLGQQLEYMPQAATEGAIFSRSGQSECAT